MRFRWQASSLGPGWGAGPHGSRGSPPRPDEGRDGKVRIVIWRNVEILASIPRIWWDPTLVRRNPTATLPYGAPGGWVEAWDGC
jgi:hypothetical protein